MLASMQVWGMASRLLCMSGYFGFHLVIVRSSVEPQYVSFGPELKGQNEAFKLMLPQNAQGFLSISGSKMEHGWILYIYFDILCKVVF